MAKCFIPKILKEKCNEEQILEIIKIYEYWKSKDGKKCNLYINIQFLHF
jgi:hypothetical protein